MQEKQVISLENGQRISYFGMVTQSGNTYLLLSPGVSNSEFFIPYFKYLNGKSYLIPDYPGRGQSTPQKNNSTRDIATAFDKFLNSLNVNKVVIIAYSFGTQIASELIELNPTLYEEVHLVAPGQYFKKTKRLLIKSIFIIPQIFKRSQPFFRYLIIKSKYFDDTFPKENLDSICKQWISTLSYRCKQLNYQGKLYIYNFSKDEIVDRSSVQALTKSLTDYNVVTLEGKHPLSLNDYREFENSYLMDILK